MKKTDKYFDQRVAKRYVNRGVINQADYDKFIKDLPDESDNLETVSFENLDPPAEEPASPEETEAVNAVETSLEETESTIPESSGETPQE